MLKSAGRHAGVNIWFQVNNLSLLWPIDTKLVVWVAYVKRHLWIATFWSSEWCDWCCFSVCFSNYSGSGNIVTFVQFLLIATEGFINTADFGRAKSQIPMRFVLVIKIVLKILYLFTNEWKCVNILLSVQGFILFAPTYLKVPSHYSVWHQLLRVYAHTLAYARKHWYTLGVHYG